MKPEIAKILERKIPNHRLEKFDIAILETNKKNRINKCYFKKPNAKNLSSFAIESYYYDNQKSSDSKVVESLDENYTKFEFPKKIFYIHKDVFERPIKIEVFFRVDKFHPLVDVHILESIVYIRLTEDEVGILSKFSNIKIDKEILADETTIIKSLKKLAQDQERIIENAKTKIKTIEKDIVTLTNNFNCAKKILQENINEDIWAEQALIYELTKGSFK